MKVKNINGTSGHACKCGSWLKHWERISRKAATSCAVLGCQNRATVGVHVQRENPDDNNWYIIPLCDSHNRKSEVFDLAFIQGSVTLVMADVRQTCGR